MSKFKRLPFTELDRRRIVALSPNNVTNLPSSIDKSRARRLNDNLINRPELGMTPRQRYYLLCLAYRYRRRLPAGLANFNQPVRVYEVDEETEQVKLRAQFEEEQKIGYVDGREPTDEDIEELAAYKRDAIMPSDELL
jgi:hypothetical protein